MAPQPLSDGHAGAETKEGLAAPQRTRKAGWGVANRANSNPPSHLCVARTLQYLRMTINRRHAVFGVLAGILPATAPVGSARSALRLVTREAITPILTQSPGRATRGICRLVERRREQEMLQLAKCPFGKLARPVLAHPKRKHLVAVRAYLAIQAAFEKEDVVVRVAIWSAVHVFRQPSAARAQPTTVRVKRSRSRSKDEAGRTLPW